MSYNVAWPERQPFIPFIFQIETFPSVPLLDRLSFISTRTRHNTLVPYFIAAINGPVSGLLPI